MFWERGFWCVYEGLRVSEFVVYCFTAVVLHTIVKKRHARQVPTFLVGFDERPKLQKATQLSFHEGQGSGT